MATSGERPAELTNAHIGEVKAQFDALQLDEMLDLEGTFTARDVDRDRYDTKNVLKALRRWGAIEVVGDVMVEAQNSTGRSRVNQYQWKPSAVEYLREYKESRTELPCGCHAHIYHRNDGKLSCRFCDDDPEFDRETVKEAMDE